MHDEMMMKENRSLSKYAFVEVKPMHKTLNNDVTVLGLAGRAVLAPRPTLAHPCTPRPSARDSAFPLLAGNSCSSLVGANLTEGPYSSLPELEVPALSLQAADGG